MLGDDRTLRSMDQSGGENGIRGKKITNRELGLSGDPGRDLKTETLARMLWNQKTVTGRFTAREVFDYVIWGEETRPSGYGLPHAMKARRTTSSNTSVQISMGSSLVGHARLPIRPEIHAPAKLCAPLVSLFKWLSNAYRRWFSQCEAAWRWDQ